MFIWWCKFEASFDLTKLWPRDHFAIILIGVITYVNELFKGCESLNQPIADYNLLNVSNQSRWIKFMSKSINPSMRLIWNCPFRRVLNRAIIYYKTTLNRRVYQICLWQNFVANFSIGPIHNVLESIKMNEYTAHIACIIQVDTSIASYLTEVVRRKFDRFVCVCNNLIKLKVCSGLRNDNTLFVTD